MDPHLILLNGPPGVGKTTVARCLATLRPGTICIAGDTLRAFAPEDPEVTRATIGAGSTYRAGAALAAIYFDMGAKRVIFEYVAEGPVPLAHFREAAPANVPLHVITLWAPLAEVLARAAGRSERGSLGARVEACYRAMEPQLTSLGHVLATNGRTVEQVAADIDSLAVTIEPPAIVP